MLLQLATSMQPVVIGLDGAVLVPLDVALFWIVLSLIAVDAVLEHLYVHRSGNRSSYRSYHLVVLILSAKITFLSHLRDP